MKKIEYNISDSKKSQIYVGVIKMWYSGEWKTTANWFRWVLVGIKHHTKKFTSDNNLYTITFFGECVDNDLVQPILSFALINTNTLWTSSPRSR